MASTDFTIPMLNMKTRKEILLFHVWMVRINATRAPQVTKDTPPIMLVLFTTLDFNEGFLGFHLVSW